MLNTAVRRLSGFWLAAFAVALLLPGPIAAQQAGTASLGAGTTPGAARIWFYRDYAPYGAKSFAPVSLNGTLAGYVDPSGRAFYRDVPAGRYHITVDSKGIDANQDRTVDLAPGQEAFVKILESNTWDTNGDEGMFNNDTFYVSLVPPQIARAQISGHPSAGRGG